FYRYHVKDPVYYHKNIKVVLQQIGGARIKEVRKLIAQKAPMDFISNDAPGHFYKLKERENPPKITDQNATKGWVNFYRQDDWCTTAYFYLDHPNNKLPKIAPVSVRIKDL